MLLKRLNVVSDYSLIDTLLNLLINAYPLEIRGYLIYSDPNYSTYLKKIIDSENNFFFVAETDGQIVGFAHFKKINADNIFLNNIIITKEFRGKSVGSFLLLNSINVFKINAFKYLLLDVFENNITAFEWYKRLGLSIIGINNWYDVSQLFYKETNDEIGTKNYQVAKDENDFSGIYINGIKIASIINNATLVFKDDNTLFNNLFTLSKAFKRQAYNKAVLITGNVHDFSLLSKSYQLSIEINNLEFKA